MYDSDPKAWATSHALRRRYPRFEIRCRARILIGKRHYTGYLHNISRGGAKLRTITPIHRPGKVLLRLPDLPPLRCTLRWTDSYNAGVSFELALTRGELANWARSRSAFVDLEQLAEAEIEGTED